MGGAHHSKWWYSTVHLVTAILGAGILSLPSAMIYLGWWTGMLMLTISWFITMCTLWQMIQLHDQENQRVDTFAGLGDRAFPGWGWYMMFTLQMLVQVSVGVAYMVTGGYGIFLLLKPLGLGNPVVGIVIFAAMQIPVCLFPSFTSMTWVSTLAMFMSIGYSMIIVGTSVHLHGTRHRHVQYEVPKEHRIPKTFNAFGQIAFAFGGQNIVLEVQSGMRSTPDKPSRIPMWHGVLVGYIVVALCYFPVTGVGYWAFGNMTCSGNVLQLLEHPKWSFYAANLMLVLHLTVGYQVYALPIYENLQPVVRRMVHPSQLISLFVARFGYVASTCFVAVLMPFFSELLGLLGGLALAPSAYFMPCVMWLAIKKPPVFSLSWLANMACIVFGVALTSVALLGSLWSIIDGFRSSRHKFFQFPESEECR